MEDALATLLSQLIGPRSIATVAADCGLPTHQLEAIVYRRSHRPRPEVLEAISRGLGVPYETLALAAYGVIAPPAVSLGLSESEAAPWSPQEEPARRRPAKAATGPI